MSVTVASGVVADFRHRHPCDFGEEFLIRQPDPIDHWEFSQGHFDFRNAEMKQLISFS